MECTDEKDERKIEKITRKSICLSIYLYTILLNLTLSAPFKKKKTLSAKFSVY